MSPVDLTAITALIPSLDIPRMLRELADRIDAGDETFNSLVVIGEPEPESDNSFSVLGFGKCGDAYRVHGLVYRAMLDLL